MSARQTLPSDARMRAALLREPSAGLAASVFADLVDELDRTPQVRRRWIAWPIRGELPAVGGSPARARLGMIGLVVVALLALVAGFAAVVLIGALRHAPPFGLARPGLIAYDSDGRVYVANADGSGPRVITASTDDAIEPAFSLDGTHLAYFAIPAGAANARLMAANADGTSARAIAELGATNAASGTRVAYLRLAWSPDGREIAYGAPVDGQARLFVGRLDGSAPLPIGPTGLEARDPSWSPDGRLIAFVGGHYDADRGVYIIGAHGTGEPIRLTSPSTLPAVADAAFGAPMWAPDGRSIAYAALFDSGESHVLVAGTDGGDVRDISGSGADAWDPAWSPDGSWVAWRIGPFGTAGRFVVARPDGSLRSELPPTVIGSPVWSPDGRTLVGATPNESTGFTDALLLIDIVSGKVSSIPAHPTGDASWQRLGP